MEERRDRRGGLFGRRGERNSPSEPSPGEVSPTERIEEIKKEPKGKTESSLVNLNLTQVVRSADSIVQLGQGVEFSPQEAIIQPHGEYTLGLARDGDRIYVIDSQGRKIEGLTNANVLSVDWDGLRKGSLDLIKYDYITIVSPDTYSLKIDALPAYLQPYAREKIRQEGFNRIRFPQGHWRLNTQDIGSIKTTTLGDKYVLLVSEEGWIAFQTKNEQGINLLPRNWRRLDLLDGWIKKEPPEIKQAVANLRIKGLKTFISDLERGFAVSVYENDVKIAKFGSSPDELFKDSIRGIDTNLCRNPKNQKVYYYCQSNKPNTLIKLDTTPEDSSTWQTETAEFPKSYENISNLQLDPTGNFFMFQSGDSYIFLDKSTLQEVKKLPKFYNVKIDDKGRLRGIDAMGHLVIYDANFQEVAQETEKRRVARLAQELAADLFWKEGKTEPTADTEQFQHLLPAKTDFETQFNNQLQTVDSLEKVPDVTGALNKLKSRLSGEGFKPDEIDFITGGIADSIRDKEIVLAAPIIDSGVASLDAKLSSGNLTLASILEVKADLLKLKSLEGLADEGTRSKINALETRLTEQSGELFRTQGAVIVEQANGLVAGVRNELEKMTSMPDFADWQEFRLPQLVSRLVMLANDCPIEAYETQKKILAARRQLQDLSREYETRFKEKYAQVREKASEVMGERVDLLKTDVDSFLDRLRGRGFKDRNQAETYTRSSESLGLLRSEIEELKRQNPDISQELDRYLKVQIANIMSEIERGGLTTIAETGQQMELFGKTLFPKWESPVRQKTQKKVDLIFIPNARSEGPGVPADQIYGDVGLAVINSRGKMEKIRLYEGWSKEDKVRLGISPLIPPSYVAHAEFDKIREEYSDWSKGERSEIRKRLDEKSHAVRELRKKLREAKGNSQEETLGKEYRETLDDYLNFYREKHLSILHRVDRVKSAPESEYENGKGFPEEWQNNWVRDKTTEQYLEKMAQILNMQLHQQSGILTLRGDPGAGKDVLVSMFSNRTNRPYFATDCTKWDTPYEFSEDIVLESKDGASQTVHVPSTVLNGITTPGGIVYLNEIHALTEQAQVFLHALTDAKRRITLKTSSGKVVRAHPSVILMASMNPRDKDNIEPALRDRMVFMDVDYPPLHREKDADDANSNLPYDASEALRIARDVASLSDLTIDPNMDRNEFVRMWDKYVNGIQNGAEDPSTVQRFDIDVILALVQFANKLRENFVARISRRTQTASKALPVSIPATGRPLRDCAYFLSQMPSEQKVTGNPEATAKKLLEDWFLNKIDNVEDRETIKTAMTTWTSSKRPAA